MKRLFKILLPFFLFLQGQAFANGNYCAAVRGNGELVPAHWAALAKIVENKGMPMRMAGGSSASISMLMMDAISRNPMISPDNELAKLEQSLLLKSIMGHLNYLWQEDSKAPKLMGLVANLKNQKFLGKLKTALKLATSADEFFHLLGEYGAILNPALVKQINKDFSFGKAQLVEALAKLGKFDAKNDMALFYREGVVDFKFVALMLGKVADFYAAFADTTTKKSLQLFIKTCALKAKDLWWNELTEQSPQCNKLFSQALDNYYSQKTFANKMIFEKVGSGLSAIPSTAIVKGEAVSSYRKRLDQYQRNRGVNTPDFSLDFSTQLSYGYWGSSETLAQTQRELQRQFSGDTKSQKFLALPNGNWFEVIATSPAEPGLANLQRIPNSEFIKRDAVLKKSYFKKLLGFIPTHRANLWFDEENPQKSIIPFRQGYFSAGGWSDLHPTLVLRASGCQEIVYVTRQGGDSVFAQQIFIRLTGHADKIRFWKEIRDNNRTGWTNLTQEEEDSPWNQIFNLGNRNSSYSRSIRQADAVYCTNWDSFDLFAGELLSIEKDAWSAPIFMGSESSAEEYLFAGSSENKSNDGFPGCIPKFN